MLREEYPPMDTHRTPMGDVFTSCNWALRDGFVHIPFSFQRYTTNAAGSAPKTGFKRIFLITDEDDPHTGSDTSRLMTTAKTNLGVRFFEIP